MDKFGLMEDGTFLRSQEAVWKKIALVPTCLNDATNIGWRQ